tara:strand:- start:179 stop:427 length:249 start_codon:yes stop_codon:yes gene_type:complete
MIKIEIEKLKEGINMGLGSQGVWTPELADIMLIEIQKQALNIQNVSQQRELLLAYHRYLTEELSLDLHEIWVDEHLKANNCG